MEIFAFLIIVVLLLILVPIFRVGLTVWNLKRKMTRQFRNAAGDNGAFREGKRAAEAAGAPTRRKVFSKDDGEYVAFEEITVEETVGGRVCPQPDNVREEPRISDAQFEEI